MASILIIEDEMFLGDILTDRLEQSGFEVRRITDGAKAMEEIRTGKSDLILLDLTLPGMSGQEILAEMKKDQNMASIPVIVLSNSDRPEDISSLRELGVRDYLVKAQFDPGSVVQRIKEELHM